MLYKIEYFENRHPQLFVGTKSEWEAGLGHADSVFKHNVRSRVLCLDFNLIKEHAEKSVSNVNPFFIPNECPPHLHSFACLASSVWEYFHANAKRGIPEDPNPEPAIDRTIRIFVIPIGEAKKLLAAYYAAHIRESAQTEVEEYVLTGKLFDVIPSLLGMSSCFLAKNMNLTGVGKKVADRENAHVVYVNYICENNIAYKNEVAIAAIAEGGTRSV
jgi:hypothetical protein